MYNDNIHNTCNHGRQTGGVGGCNPPPPPPLTFGEGGFNPPDFVRTFFSIAHMGPFLIA